MPAREVVRVADALPIHLTLACHVGEALSALEQDAAEMAASARGDADFRRQIEMRAANDPSKDPLARFARRVLALLDGGR